jgi:hypothetical protein
MQQIVDFVTKSLEMPVLILFIIKIYDDLEGKKLIKATHTLLNKQNKN